MSTALKVSAHVEDKRLTITPEEASKRFSRIVEKNMSPSEIDSLNKTGGARLVIKKMPGVHEAEYHGIVQGKHCFTIDPDVFRNEETVTHETIHALQMSDESRPSPDKKLRTVKTLEDLSLKEALTEAETIARVHTVNLKTPNYYRDIKEECRERCPSTAAMKKEDRMTLTDGTDKPQGSKAVSQTYKKFEELHISQFRYKNSKRTARQQFRKKKMK